MDNNQQQAQNNTQIPVQPQEQVVAAPQVATQPAVQSVPSSAAPAMSSVPQSTSQQPQDATQPQSAVPAQEAPMQELIDQVERDLLAHIYTNLKENKLSGVAAQELAKEFLALLPFKDKKDLVDKLSSLGQKYPEARETYVNLGIPIEEQQRQERLDQMRTHIKSGNIDKALEVAKGGNTHAGIG